MNLLIVDVRHYQNSLVRKLRVEDYILLESWLRRAFPVKTMNVSWGYWDPPYSYLPEAETVNSNLSWHKAKSVLNGEDKWKRYYGMAIDTAGFMRGLAVDIPSTVASGPAGVPGLNHNPGNASAWDFDVSYGDWYGGHELGHTYGRSRVACSGAEKGVDYSYPYSSGSISPTPQSQWDSNAIYGLDASGPTVIPPSWRDVMTYCANEWISDYTYEGIYNRMKSEKPLSAAEIQALAAAGVEHLAIFGRIDMPTDAVTLDTFYRVPDSFDVFGRDTSGEYSIRFLGAGDSQLADYPSSPRHSPDFDEPTGLITEFVPWVPGTLKIAILHGSTVLASRNVSATTPTVTITSPNGGTFGGDSPTVTWIGGDADGDALTYSLDYSRDGGVTWEPLSASVTATQATLDLSLLPGTTQGRFRVWAGDGVNTAVDQSDANFTVAGKPPKIVALAPPSGKTYVLGQTVTLEGQAYDAEDGMLPDLNLEWSSDLDGTLGTGALLQTADLTLGTHTITLKATDSDNNLVQATTTVVVTEEPVSGSPTFQVFLPLVIRSY